MRQYKIIGKYVVYSNGDVFSLTGGQFLKPYMNNSGYLGVTLNKTKYMLHVLIAKTFIKNPDKKKCVDHIDGNRQNNDCRNLQWMTYSENINKAYQQSGLDQYRNCVKCKLFVDEVLVGTFRSVKECAVYAEMNFRASSSSLSKYSVYKNIRLEKC